MQQYIKYRPEISKLKSPKDIAPANPAAIHLDKLENPYPLPPEIQQQLQQRLRDLELNRYPEMNHSALITKIKQTLRIPDSLDLVLGNGSSELISLLMQACNGGDNSVMFPSLSYFYFKRCALLGNKKIIELPLQPDFQLDIAATIELIQQHQPELILLANPNNPTANSFAATDIATIINLAPGLVIIDEVYEAYSTHSYVPEILNHENLLVLQSFSKIGLAGLRLGYLIGQPEIINYLDRFMLPYNISSFSQMALSVVLDNYAYLDLQIKQIIKDREFLCAQLAKLDWLQLHATAANFIVLKLIKLPAKGLYLHLRSLGISVQLLCGLQDLLENCLRFSIGTSAECLKLLDGIRSFEHSNELLADL